MIGSSEISIGRLWSRYQVSKKSCGIGRSGLRSASSDYFVTCRAPWKRKCWAVGANYRAAGRARSKAEFVAKMGIVVEEADETVFWIECLIESGIVKPDLLTDLLSEANELLAIFAASQRTARR